MFDNYQQPEQSEQRPQRQKNRRPKTRARQFMIAFLIGDVLLIGVACILFFLFAPSMLPALSDPTETQTPPPTSTPLPTATPLPPTLTPTLTEIPLTSTPSPTITATPEPPAGTVITSEVDGMNLHYVPSGEFTMGNTYEDALAACNRFRSGCELAGLVDEAPPHTVNLDAFWIDETEVTNSQYALCVDANRCQPPAKPRSRTHALYYNSLQYIDYPVMYVSWQDAQNYCAWAGRALPSEAQWEKAARGVDKYTFPWGEHSPNPTRLNYFLSIGDTSKVGNYATGASPYGALDMGGNVWEWTSDWYIANYYAVSPDLNPRGPTLGQFRVLRGGAWDGPIVRASERAAHPPASGDDVTGFRCARSAQ